MNDDIPRNALDRRRFLQLMGMAGAGVALGACSSKTPAGSSTGSVTTTTKPAGFPIGAAASASSKPVPVTMWHSMTENNLVTLQKLVSTFNGSQSDVKVSLVNQSSYTDTLTTYTAALGTSNLPDLVQMESIDLQEMVDSQSVVPAGDAVAADTSFDLTDVLPSAIEYFKVDGTLYGMPWNESSQIMYYNKAAFTKAGLDPTKPPATLAEYQSMSLKIVSSGAAKYGTSLKLTPSNIEDWLGQAGDLLVNNNNGRTARATSVAFEGSIGAQLFGWYEEMFTSKAAQPTNANNYDNLYAIAFGTAPMTIETSAALGTVLKDLSSFKNVELGVGPLPSPSSSSQGVPYGGAGLYIVKHSVPERQDGAWQFIKFLLTAPSMAAWSLGSGYIPITKSAVTDPSLEAKWAEIPQYRVAYEMVLNTTTSAATAGAVCGPLDQIETEMQNGLTSISTGTSATSALAHTVTACNSDISSYNQRV
jgi:sn-glycerol 3-phosphate transport system substrate-binding protein